MGAILNGKYHVKDDEAKLLEMLQEGAGDAPGGHLMPRDAAAELDIPERRAVYYCEKWWDRGWLECGVSSRTGWLTDEGKAVRIEWS